MARRVQIAPGYTLVSLPDGDVYNAGTQVILTDDEWNQVEPRAIGVSVLDLGAVGGGGSGGDPGEPVEQTTYIHNQPVPSTTWTIPHNLARYPSVTVVDSANSEVIGDVDYTNSNSLTVTFGAAFSGTAYLN